MYYKGKIGVCDDDGVVADGPEVRDAGVDRAGETEPGCPEYEGSLSDRPVGDCPSSQATNLSRFARGGEHYCR